MQTQVGEYFGINLVMVYWYGMSHYPLSIFPVQ